MLMREETLSKILAETGAEIASHNFFDGDVYWFYRSETRYLIDEKGVIPQDFWLVTCKAKRNDEVASTTLHIFGNNRVIFSNVNGRFPVTRSRCGVMLSKQVVKEFAQVVFRTLVGGYILSAIHPTKAQDLIAKIDVKSDHFYGHIADCRGRSETNLAFQFTIGDTIDWSCPVAKIKETLKIEDTDRLRSVIKYYIALQLL